MATDFRTGSVSANGLRFHFLECGDGPLALCLHGFPDHARSFRFQLPALAAAGFRAVAPYLRGYAPTDAPAQGPYQTAALAQDVIALIDALGYPSASVIGHDWGAVAAFGAAKLAPAKLTRLVALSVPHVAPLLEALVTNPAQQRRSWYIYFFQLPLAEDAVRHHDFAFLERIWQDWSPGWRYPPEEMALLKATFRKPGVVQAALAYYRALLNPAVHDPALAALQATLFVPAIVVPSLYFHGARDGCIGVELTEAMDALFSNGLRKVIFADAGHFVHQEKPQEVNAELVTFLASGGR
jgi:pimeloyl-ACP methyl ester carboxylesterase